MSISTTTTTTTTTRHCSRPVVGTNAGGVSKRPTGWRDAFIARSMRREGREVPRWGMAEGSEIDPHPVGRKAKGKSSSSWAAASA
jgi:hypothetical protein